MKNIGGFNPAPYIVLTISVFIIFYGGLLAFSPRNGLKMARVIFFNNYGIMDPELDRKVYSLESRIAGGLLALIGAGGFIMSCMALYKK